MSNKIVPGVYSAIIQEVVGSLKADFDEFGVGDEVLRALQQKWEARVVASRAADFADPQAHLGLAGSNPHAAHFTGIGAVAMNNAGIQRTGSPNINRTNSPANVAHSRAASRTNSTGAAVTAGGPANAYNRPSSASFSSTGGQSTSSSNVQVKSEPVERFLPGTGSANQQYPSYNSGMHGHHQLQQGMGAVPNLNSYGPVPNLNMSALNTFNATRGVSGYGHNAGSGPGDPRNILMLPRGALPYSSPVNGATNTGSKMPQVDGSWDEDMDEDSIDSKQRRRKLLMKRYPWMAEARLQSLEEPAIQVGLIPQVDGPTPATPPVIPPLNLLPPLNSSAPPPLNLPPINSLPQPGARGLHPSLIKRPSSSGPEIKRSVSPSGSNPNGNAGPSSSFARNPNVPAQPSEDINSDLDDSDEEDGPQEQPGNDPDADVTYCTYDKVTRVKTKWKVVFRDGMVHANGKDYLFGRCTGEFDW